MAPELQSTNRCKTPNGLTNGHADQSSRLRRSLEILPSAARETPDMNESALISRLVTQAGYGIRVARMMLSRSTTWGK
jgi:hypothetical protein